MNKFDQWIESLQKEADLKRNKWIELKDQLKKDQLETKEQLYINFYQENKPKGYIQIDQSEDEESITVYFFGSFCNDIAVNQTEDQVIDFINQDQAKLNFKIGEYCYETI